MNTATDNALSILTTALAPRLIKRGGAITEVSVAWIPSMQRKYVSMILAALLAQQEEIQVLKKRVDMLEARQALDGLETSQEGL